MWEEDTSDTEDASFFTPNKEEAQEVEEIYSTNTAPSTDVYQDLETDINLDDDEDKAFQLQSIESHTIRGKSKKPYLFCIWKNGDSSWEEFGNIRHDFPMQTASYVVRHKLRKPFKPQWASKTAEVLEQVHQDITQRRMKKPTIPLEMFGVKVYRTVKEVYIID